MEEENVTTTRLAGRYISAGSKLVSIPFRLEEERERETIPFVINAEQIVAERI